MKFVRIFALTMFVGAFAPFFVSPSAALGDAPSAGACCTVGTGCCAATQDCCKAKSPVSPEVNAESASCSAVGGDQAKNCCATGAACCGTGAACCAAPEETSASANATPASCCGASATCCTQGAGCCAGRDA
jgi:hypothetical protein